MNVVELTAEHYGWLVEVDDHDSIIKRRQFELLEVRTWTLAGVTYVGLTARNDGELPAAFKGSERRYTVDTSCELIRQVRKPRRSRRSGGVA